MKSLKFILLITTLCNLLNTAKTFAQDSLKKIEIEHVNIHSNRLLIPFDKTNRNIEIITKKQIESLPVQSVQELLSYVTGIDVRQRGPKGVQSDISIQGGTFEQTLILINGIKIIDPQTGHHLMNLPVPMSSIERIEILKGAASRKYGINAINGAINIITKENILKNSADVYLGSGTSFQSDTSSKKLYNSQHLALNTNFRYKSTENILSISKDLGNGYRYNTAFDNQKYFLNTRFAISDKESINMLHAYTYNSFGANAFYAAPFDVESTEKVETYIGSIDYTKKFNRLSISPRLSYRYNFDDYIYIRSKPEVYRNKHFSHNYNFEINSNYKMKSAQIGLGLEYRNENLRSNNLGNRMRENYGLHLEYQQYFLKNKLDLNVGFYYNYNTLFSSRILPGFDIAYALPKNIKIFAAYGTGQRIPSYTDLYYDGPANIGNENLIPELSQSYESGLKYSDASVKINATIFRRNIENFIDWTKDSLANPWMPSNFNTLETWGFNIQTQYTFKFSRANWKPQHIGISYSRIISEVQQSDKVNYSRYLIDNLRDQLITNLSLKLFKGSEFSVQHRYLNRVNYKSYQVLDLRWIQRFNRFDLHLDVNNLLNEQYEEITAVPMLPTWCSIGLRVKI